MKNFIQTITFLILFSNLSFSQNENCATKIISPVLSEANQKDFKTKLNLAKEELAKNPESADALIWVGRRTAYLGRYEEAIEIFTKGIMKFADDARFYRHRGHRHITIRCFDKAISDFEKAAKLIKNKADEIEPDGMPNAQNIPTSTLQSNIWYHLGLAYYLKGDFKNALRAYNECLKVSKNDDMYVATANWLYITHRRLGNEKEAKKLLEGIRSDMKLIENEGYLDILKIHKSETDSEKLKHSITKANSLNNSTVGFGLGTYYLLNGKKDEAKKIFEMIIAGNQWASFAFICAEVELGR